MANEPRSIRLNKEHRADMLNAVMKQWQIANPPPKGSTLESFIKESLIQLKKVKKSAPAEMQALKHLIQRNKLAKELKESMPELLRDTVKIQVEEDCQFAIQLDDGAAGARINFMIPVAMADELGIPYVGTTDRSVNSDNYPSYIESNESGWTHIRAAMFAEKKHASVLSIPRDFPPYKLYRESERALRKWETDREKTQEEINDYLSQFNTTGQIRDQWPEMEQYLPAHIADPARVINLPALTRSRLNERLGIQ